MGDNKDTKRVPLSIEDLLKKKKEEEQALKPKFLTKEERAEIALKKREEESKAIKKKQEEELQKARDLIKKNENQGGNGSSRYNERDTGRDRDRDRGRDRDRRDRDGDRGRDRDRGRDYDRRRDRDHDKTNRDRDPKPEKVIFDEKAQEKELEAIRERYVGGGTNKKRKLRKMNERKFTFDWDAGEDTSKDHNPLYNNPHQARLYGKGRYAGFDEQEQFSKRDKFYDKMLESRRSELEKSRASELTKISRGKEIKNMWDDRHWAEKPLSEMKERDWRIFREDFSISTKGGNIPKPLRSWKDAPLPSKIAKVIDQIGYKEPTPIQRQAIPIGLQNRDIIGVAETGSGKTASFVIPMLVFISKLPRLKNRPDLQALGPYAVILAPTRELAQQIEKETNKFAEPMGYKCLSIIGGHDITDQAFSLREGAEIIIATPGRLKDCLERRIIVLTQCTYVVMDEADRMIDMGFEPDVNFVLEAFPVNNLRPETAPFSDVDSLIKNPERDDFEEDTKIYRQTIMFSATMPPQVERLTRKYLRQAATVTIGTAGQVVETVQQVIEMAGDDNRKRDKMLAHLKDNHEPPMIIFVNQIKTCDKVSADLLKQGYRSVILHGKKSQEQRESALAQLKSGSADVLVATDVAARGIDIKDVSLVINYDMAGTIENYTHRIGRTGRAGKKGTAVTFLGKDDHEVYYDLYQLLKKSPNAKIPSELSGHEAAHTKPGSFGTNRRQQDVIFN